MPTMRDHSAVGSANMLRGVQLKRKTIFELEPELKRHIPHAGFVILPMTGHTANIEEPGLFNLHVSEFLAAVENGRWGTWKAEKPVRR